MEIEFALDHLVGQWSSFQRESYKGQGSCKFQIRDRLNPATNRHSLNLTQRDLRGERYGSCSTLGSRQPERRPPARRGPGGGRETRRARGRRSNQRDNFMTILKPGSNVFVNLRGIGVNAALYK